MSLNSQVPTSQEMDRENDQSGDKRSLSAEDIIILETSDQDQDICRALAVKSNRFSPEEISSLNIHNLADFETVCALAIDSKRRLEVGRKHGIGRWKQKTHQGLLNAHEVLQHIDPIIQIVKAVGAPYGGMAMGTITFLLTVAKNRDSIENGITDIFQQFTDRMTGLEFYRRIYNDEHQLDLQLQSRIIQGYGCFMGFCVEAVRYYCMGGMRRWLKAVQGTSTALDDRAATVKKAIFDIRCMSEELLSKNVDLIKQQNTDLKAQVTTLENEVQGLRQTEDNDRLNNIRELLNVKGYSRESDFKLLQKYEDDLRANFNQGTWTGLEIMRDQRLAAFMNCAGMKRWLQPQSCMLVLAGYNEVSVSSFGTCWLSPVALYIIATLRSPEQADPYAFYISGLEKADLLPQVLSHIAIQLLAANRRALRNDAQYTNLLGKIDEYSRAANNTEHEQEGQISRDANNALREVVLEVLNTFKREQTVWIVMDRPDQCKRRGGPNHQKKVAKALVYLLESAKPTVRVLLVVNGHDWRVEEQVDEFGQRRQDSVIVHRTEQRPLNS